MPPRFAYWTILIDGKPTAFRARDQDELLLTFHQLKRTNKDVVLRWFARGKLWESPDSERAAWRKPKPLQARDRDWRPGGQHKDPRQHFRDQKKQRNQERRAARHDRRERDARGDRSPKEARGFSAAGPGAKRPLRPTGAKKPFTPTGAKKPFKRGGRPFKPGDQSFAAGKPRGQKPWRDKPPRHRLPSDRGSAERGRDERPRRADEDTAPPKKRETPEQPPPPEQIVIKPEPPERG